MARESEGTTIRHYRHWPVMEGLGEVGTIRTHDLVAFVEPGSNT
jgi:hypothetical protein